MKEAIFNTIYALPSTGIATLDQGLEVIKNISVGIIALIGIVVLVWGLFDFFTALNQHDTAQFPNSFKRIASGVLMMCIGAVLGLFV